MKLTNLENQIASFLQTRTDSVSLEELFKFSKQGVKAKTVQKNYSDLVLKYKRANIPIPWACEVVYSSGQKAETQPAQRLIQIQIGKPKEKEVTAVERDYRLDRNCMAVISKQDGKVSITNHEDWYVMKYLHENAGKRIRLEEFKDVLWEHAGSRLPARWFDSVQRRIQGLRRTIPSMRDRLTVSKDSEGSFYMFV